MTWTEEFERAMAIHGWTWSEQADIRLLIDKAREEGVRLPMEQLTQIIRQEERSRILKLIDTQITELKAAKKQAGFPDIIADLDKTIQALEALKEKISS